MEIEAKLPRLVVCVSGGGSNLQALLDAIASGQLRAEIVLVVANRKGAYGLVRARNAGIPTLYHNLLSYKKANKTREQYDSDLANLIVPYQPDLIVLAGWMHIFTNVFVERFPQQVINLHPALPDTYAGADGIGWAFAAYQKGQVAYSGCMVHWVIEELDAGIPLATATVPLYPNDTKDTFAQRMHQTEHELIVFAVCLALQQEAATFLKR
jgi:formyltetrahydrofolate-dependent phosphoribosylglycinamide formyltransferase